MGAVKLGGNLMIADGEVERREDGCHARASSVHARRADGAIAIEEHDDAGRDATAGRRDSGREAH